MRPLRCRNEQKRKQISQSPVPLAACEPSVLGTAADTARATGSPPCHAVPRAPGMTPGPSRRRQRGAVDNPWLMFRCCRLVLFESILAVAPFPWMGKPTCITSPGASRAGCRRTAPPCFLPGCPRCSVQAALLCAGSAFPTHSRREGIPAAEQGELAAPGQPPPRSAQPPGAYWHVRSHLKVPKIAMPRDIGWDRASVAPGMGFTPRFHGAPVIALRGEVVTP